MKGTLEHSITERQLNFRDKNYFHLLWWKSKQVNRYTGRQPQDSPQKGRIFFSSFAFCRVLLTADSMRWYMQPIQVAQVVHLLPSGGHTHACDLKKGCCVSHHSLKIVEEILWYYETGSYMRRAGQGYRRVQPSSRRRNRRSYQSARKMTSSGLLVRVSD